MGRNQYHSGIKILVTIILSIHVFVIADVVCAVQVSGIDAKAEMTVKHIAGFQLGCDAFSQGIPELAYGGSVICVCAVVIKGHALLVHTHGIATAEFCIKPL